MNPIEAMTATTIGAKAPRISEVDRAEGDFAKMIGELVSQVQEQQTAADLATQKLHTGEGMDLHEAMVALEQANISLRFLVQVRNKALDAYQEIMRMQV